MELPTALVGLVCVLLIIQFLRQKSCDERIDEARRNAEREISNQWRQTQQHVFKLYADSVANAHRDFWRAKEEADEIAARQESKK